MGSKPKKHLILSILLCSAISTGVSAATIETLTLNAGRVNIEGKSDDVIVSFKVYKDGDTGTNISEIYEIGQKKVEDGKFSVSFKMPTKMHNVETGGWYKIDIKDGTKNSAKITERFLFMGLSYRTAFLSDLNAKTTASEVFALFEGKSSDNLYDNTDIMKNLGADTDYYIPLNATEKSKIATAFFKETENVTVNEENFSKFYSHAQAVQYMSINTITQDWLGSLDLEIDVVKNGEVKRIKFKDAETERKDWIFSIINDGTVYESYPELEGKCSEANALYELDNAKYTEYDTLLAIPSYDAAIGISLETYYNTTYKNMLDSNKYNVNKALKNDIVLSKPKTKEAFKEAYEKAIEDEANAIAAQNQNPGGLGGGGGAGGGSSAGGSSGGGVSVILPEVTNPTTVVSSFSDISSVGWAETAITTLAKKGVIAGYGDNTFKPEQTIKREEFIKMVIAAANIDLDKPACNFDDVEQDKWYAQYVNAAFALGIVSGTSDSDFGIGEGITREDMAVIIARLLNLEDGDTTEVFADDASISGYAKESIYKLYRAGKIAGVGDNHFAPKEIVTRAQAAKIIYDALVSGN